MGTKTPLIPKRAILLVLAMLLADTAMAQNINGQLDDPMELVTKYTVPIRMNDSIALYTDVYLPILQDDISYQFSAGGTAGTIKLVKKGTQYMRFPGQADPLQLPIILARTPYNKESPTQGLILALLGYGGAVQDMRGRYASEGVYIPMYSDSWNKNPYHVFPSPLDITGTANLHEDGYQTLRFLLNRLRYDSDGDGLITSADRLVSNGKIGMFGASALGNAQYQAAAAHRINPALPGLKALMPVVGSGEFYKSTGFPNGVFRERIITGWLGGQLNDLQQGIPDPSVTNSIHTPADYNKSTIEEVKQLAYDAWTVLNRASYPNSRVRADLDISRAYVDASGEGQANGAFSRYTNLNVPIYHLTGWWDIFVDGQIETWRNTVAHIPAPNKHLQKLVVGPWTHQTIGAREVGDMTGPNQYKANVADILKVDVSEVSSSTTLFTGALLGIMESELLQWYRYNLGEPLAFIPANDWQYIDSANSPVQVKIPSQDYQVPYTDFINFLNGGAGLADVPVEILIGPGIPPVALSYPIPATGQSLFGDSALTVFSFTQQEFNASLPGGIHNVRLYVTGPINDGVPANAQIGNYWLGTDEFPLPQTLLKPYYLHTTGTLDTLAPVTAELPRSYTHDPDNPVQTIGGGNMLINIPATGQRNQGQMNLANPQWQQLTMDSARVLQFQTGPLTDSLSVIGYPEMRLFAQSNPAGASGVDRTDTDFVVRVLDVYPDGRELYVTEGTVNARARAYAASVAAGAEDDTLPFENIQAGQTYEYHFRMLPLAHTWGQGHRLKILVSSSNYPRYQSNPNLPIMPNEFFRRQPADGQTYIYNGVAMSPRVATNTVVFSAAQASAIYLPVLDAPLTTADPIAAAQQPGYQLYPTPASTGVMVVAPARHAAPYQLHNAMGQQLAQGTLAGLHTWVDLSGLPNGTYFLRINQPGSPGQTLRIVKM